MVRMLASSSKRGKKQYIFDSEKTHLRLMWLNMLNENV